MLDPTKPAVEAAEPFRQPTRKEYDALVSEVERLTKERDDAYEDARSKQERMQRVIDGSKTLAAGIWKEAAKIARKYFDNHSRVNAASIHQECMDRARKALSDAGRKP